MPLTITFLSFLFRTSILWSERSSSLASHITDWWQWHFMATLILNIRGLLRHLWSSSVWSTNLSSMTWASLSGRSLYSTIAELTAISTTPLNSFIRHKKSRLSKIGQHGVDLTKAGNQLLLLRVERRKLKDNVFCLSVVNNETVQTLRTRPKLGWIDNKLLKIIMAT